MSYDAFVGTKHIYLVRHGQTDSNVDGIFRGRESALTDTGREQARVVATRIGAIEPTALVSSSFPRALETAEAIARETGLSVESSDLFTEWLEASALFGKSRTDPGTRPILDAIDGQQSLDYKHSDDESFAELLVRGQTALDFLRDHTSERICVVTHGAFLRILFGCVVFREDFTRQEFMRLFKNFRSMNTGVSHMRYSEQKGWQFLTLNDDAHLR